MKYLQNKESFLKNHKSINEKFDMSASGGPGANDINWGDSLVGRLINSFRRKVGIGTNLVRINQVIKQLRRNFDEIEYYSKANALTEEQKRDYMNCLIYEFIGVIRIAIMEQKNKGFSSEGEGGPGAEEETGSDAGSKKPTKIEDKNYLDEIRKMVLDVINIIKTQSSQGFKADNEDKIISILSDLADEIKRMKDEFVKDSVKEEEEEGKEEEGKEEEEIKLNTKLNKNYNNNFISLAQIIIEYDKMKKSSKAPESKTKQTQAEIEWKDESNWKTNASEEEKKKYEELINRWIETQKKLGKNIKPGEGTRAKFMKMASREVRKISTNIKSPVVSESYILEAVTSPILTPLKKLYDTFIQIEPDTVSDMQKYLKMSEENQLASIQKNTINNITRLYTYILKKQGVNEKYLIKEDLNVLLSRDSKIGDLIISLYNVSKQKPDGAFDGISEGMKKALASFNSTMAECLSLKKKVESVGESKNTILYRYSDFIKEEVEPHVGMGRNDYHEMSKNNSDSDTSNQSDDTNESDKKWKAVTPEGDEYSVAEVNTETQKPILQRYWLNIWQKELVKLILTDKEVNRLNSEFQKITLTEGDETEFTIQGGMDPIIGILRCFNRAYKLHTTQVIPTGRTGGKVSNRTFMEYTTFGGGTPANAGESGGPYRNNSIFNKWESGVMDIIQDRKYQPIFDKNTKLQVGDKIKEGVGPKIREMMEDLLDGDTLYKSKDSSFGGKDAGGVQKRFLAKYFGDEDVKDVKDPDLVFGGADEMQTINNTANDMPDPITLSLEKIKPEFGGSAVGSMFVIKNNKTTSSEEGTVDKMYFYIQGEDGGEAIVIYSQRFGVFGNYILNKGNSKNPAQPYKLGELNVDKTTSEIYITKMSKKSLADLIDKKPKELNGLSSEDKGLKVNIEPVEVAWVYEEKEGKKTLLKLDKPYLKPTAVKSFDTDKYSKAPKTN